MNFFPAPRLISNIIASLALSRVLDGLKGRLRARSGGRLALISDLSLSQRKKVHNPL